MPSAMRMGGPIMNRRRFVQSTLAVAVAAALPIRRNYAAILSGSMSVDADVNAITGAGVLK